jgi:hypothetical protein
MPTDPMLDAKEYVELQNRKAALAVEMREVNTRLAELSDALLDAIEEGRFPAKAHVLNRSLWVKRQLWVGRSEGVSNADVVSALHAAGLGDEYVTEPGFNTMSLSAYIRDLEREQRNGEVPLAPEQIDIPDALRGVIKITEKVEIGHRS